MCGIPNLLTSTRSSRGTANKHYHTFALLLVGNKHGWAIPRGPRNGKVLSGRSGLHHQVGRNRAISVHSMKEDD